MTRLSKEFLEKVATDDKVTKNYRDLIERELKQLVEEIAERYTK